MIELTLGEKKISTDESGSEEGPEGDEKVSTCDTGQVEQRVRDAGAGEDEALVADAGVVNWEGCCFFLFSVASALSRSISSTKFFILSLCATYVVWPRGSMQ